MGGLANTGHQRRKESGQGRDWLGVMAVEGGVESTKGQ